MAKSKYEYVKSFETHESIVPDTFMVVRVDGRGFTRFCELHKFEKPNDLKAIKLMNRAALEVCNSVSDVILAFGESDEYSFAFGRKCSLFGRRKEKIVSTVVSIFSAAYAMGFEEEMGFKLKSTPSFDGRIVCLPNLKVLRDYFAWRQVDTHINNLYNTCFWALVQKGNKTPIEAEQTLKGTLSDFKNEMLFTEFGVNYNSIDAILRKGSILVRSITQKPGKKDKMEKLAGEGEAAAPKLSEPREKTVFQLLHVDLIQDLFWNEHCAFIE